MNQSIRLAICLLVGVCLACKEKPASQAPSSGGTAGAQSAPNPVEAVPPDLGAALKGFLGSMPIWVDIRLPDSAGEVSGTYLYLKHREEIPLSGRRRGNVLDLAEGELGKVTGAFHMEFRAADTEDGDSWEGTWNKPGRKKSLPVRLFPARADFKACHLADPESLTLVDGGSLAQEIASHSATQEDEEDPSEPSWDEPVEPSYEVTGCAGGLMSASFTWFYPVRGGAFVDNTKSQWTFDLSSKREITLWQEVDSAKAEGFSRFVNDNLTPPLEQMYLSASDEEETAGDSSAESKPPFAIENLGALGVRIEEGKVMIGWVNYFDVSAYESAMRGFDGREAWVEMPPAELTTYLRKESVLRALVLKL